MIIHNVNSAIIIMQNENENENNNAVIRQIQT